MKWYDTEIETRSRFIQLYQPSDEPTRRANEFWMNKERIKRWKERKELTKTIKE